MAQSSDVEEQLARQQEEFDEQQQQESLAQQQQKQGGLLQNATDTAKDYVKQAAKEELKNIAKEQAAAVASSIGGAVASTAPIWGPILAFLLLIVGLVIVIIVSLYGACNQNGLTGFGVRTLSTISGYANRFGVTFLPPDVCGAFKDVQTSEIAQGGTSGGGGGGASFGSTDQEKRALLASYGITVNKADCTSLSQTDCTSLDNTRPDTINEIIKITQSCDFAQGGSGTTNKCGVVVTGGSEAGHVESGTCTHVNGYKMDVSAASLLTTYIANNLQSAGARGGSGGGSRYSDPDVTSSFVLESQPAHWDISVDCIG